MQINKKKLNMDQKAHNNKMLSVAFFSFSKIHQQNNDGHEYT